MLAPLLSLLLAAPWPAPLPTGAPTDEVDVAFYETHVRPLLVARCGECHGAGQQKAGLRLDGPAGLAAGGERGALLAPGDPDGSLLITAVRWEDFLLEMPPRSRLPDTEIAVLERWVAGGAPMPEPRAALAPSSDTQDGFDLEARARHWSLQPVADPPAPAVADQAWPRDPVDRFVLARLEQVGLSPAPDAARADLLRRLSVDLTGLPPTPDELDAFEADERPDAVARTVDRLLASPRFAETWARHWLDLVRYGDTRGHEFDFVIPNAWQYRDYVVRALDADVPYDRLLAEHVAGDQLPEPRLHPTGGWDESPLGTGFWHLGEGVHSPVDIRQDQVERMANQLDVFGRAFLGLTVACARCHDHKFDAITQADYYALGGTLLSSTYAQRRFETDEHNTRLAAQIDELRRRHAEAVGPQVFSRLLQRVDDLPRATAAALEALRRGPLQAPDTATAAPPPPAFEETPDSSAHGTPDTSPAAPPGDTTTGTLAEASDAPPDPEAELRAELERRLDRSLLRPEPVLARRVLDELLAARDDADHPLARLATSEPWPEVRARAEADAARTRTLLADAQPLWDPSGFCGRAAGQPSAPPFLADGPTFGAGPVRAGQLRLPLPGLAGDGRPRLTVLAAAAEDPAWRALELAPGSEREPGAIDWVQAGRTLRTPSVVLERPRLLLLVRGGGRAATIVDGHRIVHGPLHGAVISRWDADHDRPRWIEQDLSDYLGERLHVEVSPAGSGPALELLAVLAAEARPPLMPPLLDGYGLPAPMPRCGNGMPPEVHQLHLLVQDGLLGLSRAELSDDPCAEALSALPSELRRVWTDWFLGLVADELDDVVTPPPALAAEAARLLAARRLVSASAPTLRDLSPADEQLLIRGNHRAPAGPVPRRFLEVFGGRAGEASDDSSARLELARQLTDPSHPTVARVFVNRVWQHLFGRGLVASVDDLGVMGEAPSHPELLDHLASRFVREGWSLKRLVRALVLTRSYGQSSAGDPAGRERDPDNRLLHRSSVRRLTGEALRDSLLSLSGRLDETVGGPAVPLHLTEFLQGRGRPATSGALDGDGRRSLYLSVRRNFPDPFLTVFDRPTPFSTMGRRGRSNVPAQALALMNDPFVLQQARAWALAELERPGDDAARLTRMTRAAWGRAPTEAERTRMLTWLVERRSSAAAKHAEALAAHSATAGASDSSADDGTPTTADDAPHTSASPTQADEAGADAAPAMADGTDGDDSPPLDDPELVAWADLAHVLVNVKDFAFLR